MKNLSNLITKKLVSKYKVQDNINETKSTNINILLNRVKLDRRQEIRKKFYFTAAASTGLILFGLVVFS
tara:strand:- start:1243 stop:1449 length:207 start_codon:yes stop_codon:yes gene_type:complete